MMNCIIGYPDRMVKGAFVCTCTLRLCSVKTLNPYSEMNGEAYAGYPAKEYVQNKRRLSAQLMQTSRLLYLLTR